MVGLLPLLSSLHFVRPILHERNRMATKEIEKLDIPYLSEPDILALLSEALSADVEAVLADQTGFVGADAAVILKNTEVSKFSFMGVHSISFARRR